MQANETKVEDFLSTNKAQFIIPLYQRSYSWGTAQCKQLLDDILEIAQDTEEDAAHFIGNVVYVQDEHGTTTSRIKELVIVDGQQRLTALTLIYVVLHRKAKALKAKTLNGEPLANEIYETYLANKFAQDAERIKLKPIAGDDTALEHLLNDKESKEYRGDSQIINAFDYFNKKITKDNFQAVQNGLSKLMFVEISLDRNHDDPQKIFESLNSTGLALSQADLIRNYILMGRTQDEQNELYKKYWEEIEIHAKDEEEKDTKVDASAFIRAYLTIKNKQIPDQEKVYLEFKKKYPLKEFEHLKEDLAEMVRLVKLYHKLINPKEESDKNIQTELGYMRRLDVSVAHPFLMKVYDDYENKNYIDAKTFIAVLQLVQSFVFRRFTVGRPANALNKIFMSLSDKVDNADYLYSIQKTLLQQKNSKGEFQFPPNKDVKDALKDYWISINQKKRSYYLFDRLENHENKERVSTDTLTIEHIFPQNPSPEWIRELGKEECKSIEDWYLDSIGNLTLSGNNGALGNKSFGEKRDYEKNGYKNSRLWLNKSLATLDQWNKDAIKKRGKKLTNRFLKVWAYPDITLDEPEYDEPEYEDEVNIFEVDDPTHKKPEYIIFMDEKITVKSVRDIYKEVLRQLFILDPELFFSEKMKEKTKLQKDKQLFRNPLSIDDTYFIEGHYSNKELFDKLKHALNVFNLADELSIKFSHKK